MQDSQSLDTHQGLQQSTVDASDNILHDLIYDNSKETFLVVRVQQCPLSTSVFAMCCQQILPQPICADQQGFLE